MRTLAVAFAITAVYTLFLAISIPISIGELHQDGHYDLTFGQVMVASVKNAAACFGIIAGTILGIASIVGTVAAVGWIWDKSK